MTATEVFANDATATVTAGGTTAPVAGTVESWTLSGSTLPAVTTGTSQCYVADTATATESEKILVTNISGSTATVTRGADSTTPVAHSPGFTIKQVLTHASLVALQSPAGVLLAVNNLSDVASAVTARTNLGLGSAATQSSSAFDSAGAAATAQANAEAASVPLQDATWVPGDNNLLWANADPWASSQHLTPTAGTVYLMKITARQSLTVTNLWFVMSSNASGTSTGSFVGLYSSSGTLLSGSSDIGSSLTGIATLALTTPQTLTAGTYAWAALLVNMPTMPGIQAGVPTASMGNVGLTAATARFAVNGTSRTSLAATITPSSNTLSADTFWLGVS